MMIQVWNAWLGVQGRWEVSRPRGCWSSGSGQGGGRTEGPHPHSGLLPAVTALGLTICKQYRS